MPLYIAVLRAINVGGHIVKMDRLRQLFEALNLSNVETFIASGNVLFETGATNARALEKEIETKLRDALGYEVATFLRTKTELIEIANHQPFRKAELAQAQALNIAFLKGPLNTHAQKKLTAFKTDIDDFSINGRELYWLCRQKQSESTFSNVRLEKTLGIQATLRGITTVNKLVAKYKINNEQ